MDTNGRSTQYYVVPTEQWRRAKWERIFGDWRLPVLSPRPRWQEHPGRGAILAFDLDLRALPRGALYRLAAYTASRYSIAYEETLASLSGVATYPISAIAVQVIEEEMVDSGRTTISSCLL